MTGHEMANVGGIKERRVLGEKRDDTMMLSGSPPLPIAFVVGGLYTEASGVQRIVCDLANELRRQGALPKIYTTKCNGRPLATHLLEHPGDCVAAPGRWLGGLAWSPTLKLLLQKAVREAAVVHNHNLWMLPNHFASAAAHRWGKPVVFTAMGFLEPWALARSRWKKRLVGWWFQDRDLRRAACIHVNTPKEAASVRAYGLRNPIAIVPNGVDIAAVADLPAPSVFEAAHPDLAGKRVCLFLSRLHEKKGLAHLIPAWSRVVQEYQDWHLVIAGPDDGYETQARRLVDSLGLRRSVTLVGPLYGEEKRAAYAKAECFVLPSFSEGFSMAILEAMACRLPVLLTPACNFSEVVRVGAGVSVEPTVEGTERGLRELLGLPRDELRYMGERGRRLIEQSYTWERVASQMLSLYRWLAAGGPRPAFVELR